MATARNDIDLTFIDINEDVAAGLSFTSGY
jgi:hypothetical protein